MDHDAVVEGIQKEQRGLFLSDKSRVDWGTVFKSMEGSQWKGMYMEHENEIKYQELHMVEPKGKNWKNCFVCVWRSN